MVLPVLVPPATIRLSFARTAAAKKAASPSSITPRSIRCLSRWMVKSWRRMVIAGRPVRPHHGVEAFPSGELEVELPGHLIPPLLGPAQPSCRRGDDVDQFPIRVGGRFSPDLGAVPVHEPHVVGAVDVDVGQVRVVDVRLEPPQPMDPVEDRLRQLRLGSRIERAGTVAVGIGGEAFQLGGDQ